ncbi:MAG: T9SS type A sorting domain-containing protein [Aureispira sp.]|nr:T9SS type A sorting domain-containing protein [Aureispira sp.]
MLKKSIAPILLIAFGFNMAWSQTPTYADSIAHIIYDNCSQCHHAGSIAPFSLMSYTDTYNYRNLIASKTAAREMPPWSPNPNYKQYVHERLLTQNEIDGIAAWVAGGAPQGNVANEPAPPVFNSTAILGHGDLKVTMPAYASKATAGNDDYVCFSVPTGLAQGRTLKAIEVVPGNSQIVHHVLVYTDPSGSYPTDTVGGDCAGPGGFGTEKLLAGFAPGGSPIVFPDDGNNIKMGVSIAAGSNIILAMHYPEGSAGTIDSTSVHLHFYPPGTTGVREVSSNPILAKQGFCISPNTVQTLEEWFPSQTQALPVNFSLLSIFPHAHLLGKEFLVYGIQNTTLPYDTIPLIHIPEWDFEWQDFYFFKKVLKMPAGYKLYAKVTYDNTTNNPYNPNNPPLTVCEGLNTSDEMFLIYFQYLNYQTGDENIDLDSLLNLNLGGTPTGVRPVSMIDNGLFLTAYPNPTSGSTTFEYYTDKPTDVSLNIYDVRGSLVKQLVSNKQAKGRYKLQWDGTSSSNEELANGVYITKLKVGNRITNKKIVLSR